MKKTKSKPSLHSGFSVAELLAVLAMITILALLSGTALTHSQGSSNRAVCANNLRQLTQAWQMYPDDYSGALMANPSGTGAGYLNWVRGFMDFSPGNSDNFNAAYLTNSSYAAMGLYVKSAAFFRCPADLSTMLRAGVPTLRVRSYSMNGYLGQGAVAWNVGFQVMTNLAQVPQPERTLVLLEEHPNSINDGNFVIDLAGVGAGTRIIDFPAAFHFGGANLALADGHVEYWQWADPRTMPPVGSIINLNVPSPQNVDVTRLQRVCSYRP